MQQTEYRITTEYIELNQLLKVCGLAGSGGEGGAIVTEGNVGVDGQVELRKRCKIRAGQTVQLGDVRIAVLAADPADIAARAEARIEMARAKAATKKASRAPPGVWAPVGAKTGAKSGAKPGNKARAKNIGQTTAKATTSTVRKRKTNLFADKAEAHRRRKVKGSAD